MSLCCVHSTFCFTATSSGGTSISFRCGWQATQACFKNPSQVQVTQKNDFPCSSPFCSGEVTAEKCKKPTFGAQLNVAVKFLHEWTRHLWRGNRPGPGCWPAAIIARLAFKEFVPSCKLDATSNCILQTVGQCCIAILVECWNSKLVAQTRLPAASLADPHGWCSCEWSQRNSTSFQWLENWPFCTGRGSKSRTRNWWRRVEMHFPRPNLYTACDSSSPLHSWHSELWSRCQLERSWVLLADQRRIEPPAICQRHKSAAIPTAPRGRPHLNMIKQVDNSRYLMLFNSNIAQVLSSKPCADSCLPVIPIPPSVALKASSQMHRPIFRAL